MLQPSASIEPPAHFRSLPSRKPLDRCLLPPLLVLTLPNPGVRRAAPRSYSTSTSPQHLSVLFCFQGSTTPSPSSRRRTRRTTSRFLLWYPHLVKRKTKLIKNTKPGLEGEEEKKLESLTFTIDLSVDCAAPSSTTFVEARLAGLDVGTLDLDLELRSGRLVRSHFLLPPGSSCCFFGMDGRCVSEGHSRAKILRVLPAFDAAYRA